MNPEIHKPANMGNEFYFKPMIERLSFTNLIPALNADTQNMIVYLRNLTPKQAAYIYAEGKWTALQVVQHIIDCERIFQFRALAIARGETMPLPGFDENEYAANSMNPDLSIEDVLHEFVTVREASISLFKNMRANCLDMEGKAFNLPFTPRIIGWFTAAHSIHHLNVLQTKYQ